MFQETQFPKSTAKLELSKFYGHQQLFASVMEDICHSIATRFDRELPRCSIKSALEVISRKIKSHKQNKEETSPSLVETISMKINNALKLLNKLEEDTETSYKEKSKKSRIELERKPREACEKRRRGHSPLDNGSSASKYPDKRYRYVA